jgi:hypothetical protein
MGYTGEPPADLLQSAAKGNLNAAMAQIANVSQAQHILRSASSNGLAAMAAAGSMPMAIPASSAHLAGSGSGFMMGLLSQEAAGMGSLHAGVSCGSHSGLQLGGLDGSVHGGVGGSVHGGVGGSLHGGVGGSLHGSGLGGGALALLQPHSFPGAHLQGGGLGPLPGVPAIHTVSLSAPPPQQQVGGSVHGGSVHGGSVHGGSVHGGNMLGGCTPLGLHMWTGGGEGGRGAPSPQHSVGSGGGVPQHPAASPHGHMSMTQLLAQQQAAGQHGRMDGLAAGQGVDALMQVRGPLGARARGGGLGWLACGPTWLLKWMGVGLSVEAGSSVGRGLMSPCQPPIPSHSHHVSLTSPSPPPPPPPRGPPPPQDMDAPMVLDGFMVDLINDDLLLPEPGDGMDLMTALDHPGAQDHGDRQTAAQ